MYTVCLLLFDRTLTPHTTHMTPTVPLLQVGSTASRLDLNDEDKALVFQGGNYIDLHKMMGVSSGSEVRS